MISRKKVWITGSMAIGLSSLPNVEMISLLHHLCSCKKQLFFPPSKLPLTTNSTPTHFIFFHHGRISKKTNSTNTVVHAAEKDSHHYEIDPDKAKEALQKLDQQLQDLSKKQVSPPKIKVSDIKITRDEMTEDVQAMTGSELGAVAAILFLFTIFYNIFYLTVLEPSMEPPPPPSTELQTWSPE